MLVGHFLIYIPSGFSLSDNGEGGGGKGSCYVPGVIFDV